MSPWTLALMGLSSASFLAVNAWLGAGCLAGGVLSLLRDFIRADSPRED